jgi:hypothetical protein
MRIEIFSKFLLLWANPTQRKLPAASSGQATSQKAVAMLTDAGNLAIASQRFVQARRHLSPSGFVPAELFENN